MKCAVIFDNLGPYHLARLQSAAGVCDLTAIQVYARSAEYEWDSAEGQYDLRVLTLLKPSRSREDTRRTLATALNWGLKEIQPDILFIPGWSSRTAFGAQHWCVRRGVPVVTMSESTAWDERRSAWREGVKRRIVRLCSAALVGGTPHADYMVALGMRRECVFVGYDAVDNQYFARRAAEVRQQSSLVRSRYGLPERYFLSSARFIEKKNLPRLIAAYAKYRQLTSSPEPWHLVLLGDGPLRSQLETRISKLGIRNSVHLPGFKQYAELPAYYGLAEALIHASTTEQWGLVVNEAMASGLPVLVSHRSGCAIDLVQDGRNGFTFDPYDLEALVRLMLKISAFGFPLSQFGTESQRLISAWGPERFVEGFQQAMECAVRSGPKRAGAFDLVLLKTLAAR